MTDKYQRAGVTERIVGQIAKFPDVLATPMLNLLGRERADLFTYYVEIDRKIKGLLHKKLNQAGYPHVILVSLGQGDDAFNSNLYPYTYQIVTGETNSAKAIQYTYIIINELKRAIENTDIELDYSLDAAIFFAGLKTTHCMLVQKARSKK